MLFSYKQKKERNEKLDKKWSKNLQEREEHLRLDSNHPDFFKDPLFEWQKKWKLTDEIREYVAYIQLEENHGFGFWATGTQEGMIFSLHHRWCEWENCEHWKDLQLQHILPIHKFPEFENGNYHGGIGNNFLAYCPFHHYIYHEMYGRSRKNLKHRNSSRLLISHIFKFIQRYGLKYTKSEMRNCDINYNSWKLFDDGLDKKINELVKREEKYREYEISLFEKSKIKIFLDIFKKMKPLPYDKIPRDTPSHFIPILRKYPFCKLVGYDVHHKILMIQFNRQESIPPNKIYVYYNIERAVYTGFLGAPKKYDYFFDNIKFHEPYQEITNIILSNIKNHSNL